MPAPLHLTPLDPRFPARLRALDEPPASVTLRGGALEASRAVAVIGSREATAEAAAFARELARALVRADAVVVSGGAHGVDAAAHEAALEAGGRTWAVAGTGHERCFPADHAALFDRIGAGPGAMVWPFAREYTGRSGFLVRNRVLVGISDAVVVVQAGFPSGALHSAACARKLGKPLWVVPAAPWMKGFEGSRQLLQDGARPLASIEALLGSLGLSAVPCAPAPVEPMRTLSADEAAVLAATSTSPLHLDEISARARTPTSTTAVALLTLALENVVVEDPPGLFRRRDAQK